MTVNQRRCASAPDHRVVILGAGIAGIGLGIRLKQAGIEDFVILERADDFGGTWRDNVYPGVAVDIPGFGYQFSFEMKRDWRRVFPTGGEVKAYLDGCVDKWGLRPHIRLGVEVTGGTYDDENALWHVETLRGPLAARFLIIAVGPFAEPKMPDIPGLDEFDGALLHTARWDRDVELDGRRVAVVGTGASAVQVAPTVAPVVRSLTVFQRTPVWVMPRPDVAFGPMRHVLKRLPLVNEAARAATIGGIEMVAGRVWRAAPPRLVERISRAHMRVCVSDAETRRRLTPKYGFGCQPFGISNAYWRTFNRDNVTLETTPIERVTPRGIRTCDGVEHPFDVIVMATGFADHTPPVPLRGAGGADLRDYWREHRPQAYEGATVPGFPNLLFVLGPHAYTPGSYTNLVEVQATHHIRLIKEAERRKAVAVEVTQDATARFLGEVDRAMDGNFLRGEACARSNSFYVDDNGEITILRPQTLIKAWWRARHFPLEDYLFHREPATSDHSTVSAVASSPTPRIASM
ncbi:NAD(P)/FAD-dependent oxidoreductase [Nocardia sp. NPDC051030]|uniref:flavin-containing monooxygenase n=1 Tax=Nocardia sp. NPDC051030 TaxID=3155162 RepID=UPI0034239A60